MVSAERSAAALAKLARLAEEDFTLSEMLRALAQASTECLDVDGAGVMRYVDGRNVFEHSQAAYDLGVDALEKFQQFMQDGPCTDAVRTGETIVSEYMSADDRWNGFQALADEVQVASMIAVPLISRGQPLGVLDLYRSRPGPWAAAELQVAQDLANMAVSYLLLARDRD